LESRKETVRAERIEDDGTLVSDEHLLDPNVPDQIGVRLKPPTGRRHRGRRPGRGRDHPSGRPPSGWSARRRRSPCPGAGCPVAVRPAGVRGAVRLRVQAHPRGLL